MNRIRWPAIAFAVGSALYWFTIAPMVIVAITLAGGSRAVVPMMMAANVVVTAIYAVVTVTFCHWFARRIVKQIGKT